MTGDPRTIAVYDARAADYERKNRLVRPDRALAAFISLLPPGAHVLDLGCGPGRDSVFLAEAGLRPDPVDASAAMVALAQGRGLPARLGTFDDLDAIAAYQGVWANFSLLHAPRGALPRHLAAIHRALVPGGLFHIAMKTGNGAARDPIDRLYTYVTPDEIAALLDTAGFVVENSRQGVETGLAGTSDPYIVLLARRAAT